MNLQYTGTGSLEFLPLLHHVNFYLNRVFLQSFYIFALGGIFIP
jgi:hypothetical protein